MRRSNARSQALDLNSTVKMDASKLQFRPSATSPSRFSLFSRLYSPPIPKHSRGSIWIPISAAVSLAVFLYLFIVSKSHGEKRFGIIIDGGSSGTRIHVFAYIIGRGSVPVFNFGATASMKVNPGLSSYAADPERAGESLIELLEFAQASVPKDQWGDTEIRLMATAGLRLLDTKLQGRILVSCRRALRSSGFRFQNDWATVITGLDEGIYAWITANYALGTLGGDPRKTTGIIELGGASAQVTFVSDEPLPREFSHVFKYGKTTYNLYSHSFLHFGQNVAHESLRELLSSMQPKIYEKSLQEGIVLDPCTPRGYSHTGQIMKPLIKGQFPTYHTSGNFTECRSAALMLLQKGKDNCSYEHCQLGSTFIPKLQGKFIATENFFYTSKFFGLGSTTFLSDLMVAGQSFCGEDWLQLKWKYSDLDEEDLLRYCFSSAYIVALLHDGLGLSLDDRRVTVANQIGNVPLDWALGAFILQKMSYLNAEHPDWVSHIIRDDCSALLALLVFSILIYTAWSVSKWRKPQLKTIYDLEKGRYIVSHVSR